MSGTLISKKEAWMACQELLIGVNKEPLVVHEDAHEKYRKQHKLCVVARPLNSKQQPLAGMRLALPRIWKMEGKVEGRSNEDGTVSFFFRDIEDLNTVMGNAPYRFKGWMVSVDLERNYFYPTYMKKIPFRICILNLPDKYHRKYIVESIASRFGWVDRDSIQFTDPSPGKPSEVWVKVDYDANAPITLARTVRVLNYEPTVDLQFRYDGILKFCTSSGSLCHGSVDCPTRLTHEEEESQAVHICQVTGYDENVSKISRVSSFLGYTHVKQGTAVVGDNAGGALSNVVDTRNYAPNLVPLLCTGDTVTLRSPKRKGTAFEATEYGEPYDKHPVTGSANNNQSTSADMGLDESPEALPV